MASKNSAACSTGRNSDDDAESRQNDPDEELDFFSPKFNPRRALLASHVNVPFENIKTFTSVQSYQEALKRRQTRNRNDGNNDNSNSNKTSGSRESESRSISGDQQSSSRFSSTPSCTSRTGSSFTAPVDSKTETLHSRPSENIGIGSRSRSSDLNLSDKDVKHPTRQQSHFKTQLGKPDSVGKEKEKLLVSHDREIYNMRPLESRGNHVARSQRNVIRRMANTTGPLHLLLRCAEERLHVRIITRGAVLVRSICRGYIVAFDSHFNMALIDVDEYYRRPAALGKVRARRNEKLRAAQKILQEERRELAKQTQQKETAKRFPMEVSEQAYQESANDEAKITSNQQKGDEKLSKSSCEDSLKKVAENVGMDSAVENLQALKTETDSGVFRSQVEREALIMGIPDENVEHRHVNQLFIRGENVVLVSIIND